MPGQAIAGFRDADGEDIFSAIGRLSTNNFEFIIGDTTGIYPNSYGGSTGILLNQASESITFGRSQIRFQEGGGGDYVGFLAPASVTTPVIWTLPATDGTNGQALTTNGAGVLSWSSAGGAQTLQDVADYTIATDGYVAADFGAAYFEDDGGGAKWEAQDGGYQMAMGIFGATYLNFISDNGVNNSGQVEFMDSRPLGDRRGIEYVADYSADFTDRSLVDKAYVDGLANSGWTDDGTVVRLTTITDNVGIGTATPAVKLDVNAGAYGEIARFYNGDSRFVFGADLYGGEAGLYDANTGELIAGQVMGNPNLVMLGQYAMYINQTSKNVGVGTSTPDRLFHVENLDAVTNAITYGQRVTHASSGVVAAGFGTGLEFELENASNTNRIAGSIANIWGNATNAAEDGEMVFRTMLNGTLAERMRIDDYGNVAIGASDAGGYKLYVQGRTMVDAGEDATAFVVYNGPNDNYQIRVDGDANNVLLSESNGYVGIGLSNPTQLLHMTSPATAASMLLTDESGQIGIQLGYDAGGGSYLEGDYFGNDRSFTIKSNSGYKWATFGVDGTAGFGQSADDLNYAINVTDAGNVGVGTSLPDRRFQVEVDNTSHNVVTYGGRLVHTISGIGPAPTTGFGTGLEFELENGSGINRVAGTIENLWASSLNTFENSDMAFKTMQEGVLTTGLYIGDAGNVVIGGTGATDRLVINNTPATSQSFFRINGEGGAMKMGFDGIYGIFDYDYTDTGTDLSFQSNGNEVMILNDDGSVQIGLGQDPVGPMLTLMGDTSVADAPILQFRTLDSAIQSEIYFSSTGNSTYWDINSSGDGGGLILMNGTEEMAKFAGNGLVFNEGGLGTLDFRIEGDTNVNGLYFDSSGDGMLGLGTTPNSVLDVYFSDTTTALSLLDFSSFGGVNQSLMPDGAGIIWDINRSNNNGSLVFENYGTALLSINSNVSLPGVTVATTSRTTAAFDRKTTDGVIISLQQDSVQEGTISVSGNTISFNPFTGSHYAWHEGNIERATVVSLTGKNKHLNDNENSEVLYGVEITKQINSPKVLGSYLDILESQEELSTTNPALVMAVGNGEAWVADKGENIEAGDYLISSDVAGHAQKMDADFALNYVFARAAEDIDWSEVNETVDGVKHKVITVFFDSLVVNTQTVDVIKDNQSLGSKLNLAKMTVSEANKVKKQLGGEMKVGSDNSVGGMQVGQATIPSKRSAVDVTFSEKYESAPIVMLTLASDSSLMRYFVSDVTASGFRLNLYPTQYSDTLFNWQAYPASNVQSGASAEPLNLEDLPEYQVEEPVIEEEIVVPPADEVEVNETGLEILSESADAASNAGTEEANTLQLEDAEDVLYNDALSIVEAGDELSEQIEEETPAVEEVPVVEETPATEETPAVEETPAP